MYINIVDGLNTNSKPRYRIEMNAFKKLVLIFKKAETCFEYVEEYFSLAFELTLCDLGRIFVNRF